MFKRIDVDVPEGKFEGFSYANEDGDLEFVHVLDGGGIIKIEYNVGVYKRDIPKLIKALQAAYEHKE